MKTINNFIVEHLKYSTFSINEKLKISSKSNMYTCQPKDKFELREILEERLSENKNADLNDIDVSQIKDMGRKGFTDDKGLFEVLDPHNIDISEWDVSKVTDMSSMFSHCKNLDCDLSNWNVSNVTIMRNMFYGCKKFTGKGLENWKVSKVEDTYSMFSHCDFFTGKVLENWDVSNVKTMSFMFYECLNLDFDLSNWSISNVFDMSFMFDGCNKFIGKGIEKWDISNIDRIHRMSIFNRCYSFTNKPRWYKK